MVHVLFCASLLLLQRKMHDCAPCGGDTDAEAHRSDANVQMLKHFTGLFVLHLGNVVFFRIPLHLRLDLASGDGDSSFRRVWRLQA